MGSYLCRWPDTCQCVCASMCVLGLPDASCPVQHTQRHMYSGHRVQCDMTGILLRELLLASPPSQRQQWQIASSIHIDNINISSNARNLHLPLATCHLVMARGSLEPQARNILAEASYTARKSSTRTEKCFTAFLLFSTVSTI